MSDEMDLREILMVLWRGKYWIVGFTVLLLLIAVLYIFLMSPVYQYSTFLDLRYYGVKYEKSLELIEQNGVIAEAVKGFVEDPGKLLQSVEINKLENSEFGLQIKIKHEDPGLCLNAGKQICLSIIETASEYRFEELNQEKVRSEKLLIYLDETVTEYLLSRDEQVTDLLEEDPVYKRLLEEKASSLVKLKLLDFNLEELGDQPAKDIEILVNNQIETVHPVPVNKMFYIAVAIFLGLIVSVLALLLHYYLTVQPISDNRGD